MSNSTQMDRVLDGMLNFNAETKETLDSIKETIDKIFDKRYQANHTPYAVMSFEDEAHYWEEQLAYPINKIVRPTDNDDEYLSRVSVLRHNSYVFIRGNLKSGRTIRYDETKYQQLYINGERYTADYTFNGETPETYERLTVFIVQTPFNVATQYRGELIVEVADFPIENAEIYVNIGEVARMQPKIEELLETDTVESLYVNGSWTWNTPKDVYIKTLKISDNFVVHTNAFSAPQLLNYIIPNSSSVPRNQIQYAIKNVDMHNAGSILSGAFSSSQITGELHINNKGFIDASAFHSCKRLTAVYIGDGITTIFGNAFQNCSSLLKMIIGDNVTTIYQDALMGSPLKELHLGKNLTTINTTAFAGWYTLDRLTVSKGYHCATTILVQRDINPLNVVETFLEVVKNCANIGEDGRTATQMTFKIPSGTRTTITNAYNAGDEKAIELYELMDSKTISITT